MSGRASVAVMQTADLGKRHDGTLRGVLHVPCDRSVSIQGEVRP